MGSKPVYYSQLDSRWRYTDYSTSGETTNIGESGCGPTAAAMLIETISGKTFTPVDACKFALENGHKAKGQGTYYSYFEPQFEAHGIYCKMLNYTNTYGLPNHENHEKVFDHLRKGGYAIAVMGPGLWTRSGHFVTCYDVDDNYVYINDPASTAENRSQGDIKTFKSQVKYYWLVGEAKEVNVTNTTYKKIAKIPLKDISKIEIYVNSKKKNLATIKKETGADYVMNGGLFNWDWSPCPLLKVDGTMVSKAPYSMWGYGWNTGEDIQMSAKHADFENFFGSPALMNSVKKEATELPTNKDFAGSRGRSAMGMTKDSLVLFCTKDGSSEALTLEELQQAMLDLGCETGVMCDGGGSSQADFNGQKIASSRIVHNLLLVYTNGNTGATSLSPIAEIQAKLNTKYGFDLDVDGQWGPASKKAMIKAVQTEINKLYGGNLVVDGSWGNLSKAACPDIKAVTKNNLAWLIQACLIVKGYDLELDSSYGPGCATIIGQFQKKCGLTADKICGPNTFTKLLG